MALRHQAGETDHHMPRRTPHRYCRCGNRLATDNPSDRCLACVRKDQEQLYEPPLLPLDCWLTDQFNDAFAAQHMGLVSVAYRQSPFHRIPITQDIMASWLGLSQPEISRIESGPPIRHLDRLTLWARTLKIPPQLLWWDLPGQRRERISLVDMAADAGTENDGQMQERNHDQAAALLPSPVPPTPMLDLHGQRPGHAQDDGLVIPGHLAAMLEQPVGPGSDRDTGKEETTGGAGSTARPLPPPGLLPSAPFATTTAGPSSLTDLPPLHSSPPSTLLALASDGRTLASGNEEYQVIAVAGELVVAVLNRRRFVAGVGLAPGLVQLVPGGDEAARQGLARTMLGDAWGSADEWQAIVREHCTTFTGGPAEKYVRLSADLSALNTAFQHERSETGQSELRKAGAVLSALMSSVVASLGDLPACVRWARTARQLADASGDLHTRLWVRGREVAMGLYQQRSLGELLTLADEAIAIGLGQGPPRTSAWPQLLAGTAQGLAMANRPDEAQAALNHTRDSFNALSDDVLRDGSLLGASEHNLWYAESYVFTYLGDYSKADLAQEAALRLCPSEEGRGPARVEVMRALCQVRAGDIPAGITHARNTISQLVPAQRVRTIVDLGQKVIEAVPVEQRQGDEVRELGVLVGV